MANSAISSVYINEDGGLDFAGETFGKSLHSTSVIGGALGAGVSAGLNTGISAKLHNLDNGAAINKFYGSAINLGVSAAGKTAEYATYLAYAGGNFSKAYDDMGGLSFNILDAGVFADMIATNEARTNSTGQGGKWGEIAQRLKNSNAGMFEINIGRKGIRGKIGQGGMNLAGSLYDFGKRMNDKAALEEYAATHDEKIGSSVMKEYIYGDWTQENAAARFVSGLDDLEVTKAKGFTAKTTSNGHGGRHIVMQDTGNDLNNAVQLGHEAYRDGVVDENNVAETVAALFGHTNMATNMQSWGANVDFNGLLRAEVEAYQNGDIQSLMMDALLNYDSSEDYWKLVKQENGKYGLQYDGNHSLYDENGNLLIKNEMDNFDEEGIISGHKLSSENSYAASLGMLMGTFTDYSKDYESYYTGAIEENPLGVSKQILEDNKIEWQHGNYINTENIIAANPFLMTKVGIETGTGVRKITLGEYNLTLVSVKNEYNQSVGIVANLDSSISGKNMTNLTTIENMVPEGQRLKAGTIKFENGNISLYGLSSSMPDPNKMGKNFPAVADETFSYVWSLHNPDSPNAYPAMRLFQSKPSSWNEITGGTDYPNFQSGTGDWGYLRDSFPAYYYNILGDKVYTTTDSINGHKTNYEYTNSSSSQSGFMGGSLGCQTWYPTTWNQMTSNFSFNHEPVYGLYTVNRKLFGDGTNKKNNWSNKNWWRKK